MFHVEHFKNSFQREKMKTNTAWLELGRELFEVLYEQGKMTDEEYERGMKDYETRTASGSN